MKKLLVLSSLVFALLNAAELRFATAKNVGEVNPHLYSPNEMFAQHMVYEGFVNYSEDNKIVPSLATSWEISKDGKVYTFYLRKGVKFSNGEDFNAKAVKANFDAIFANKQRHTSFALARAFDYLEVVDDYTVKLHLKHVYEPTLKELSMTRPFRFIAPGAMIDGNTKDGIKAPIGTGKWKFVDTKLGIYDKFERNDNYWGEKAKIDEILCKVIPEPSTRVIALKTGEVDYLYGVGALGLEDFVNFKNTEYKTIISEPLSTILIALNTNAGATKDLAVRKALSMAIDKEAISKYVFYGTQQKADFLYAQSVPNTKIDRKPYEYNPKKAQKMLIDSGYKLGSDKMLSKNGKPLEIKLSYVGTNAEHKAIAEVIQSQLRQIGINLILNAEESTTYMKRQKTGEFDMTFNDTWGAPYEPEIFMASMVEPAHADYMAQLGLKEKAFIDETIEKIGQTTNEKQKAKLIKEVLTILHDEAVYIPIAYASNKGVASPKIKGYKSSILKYTVPFDDIEFRK